MSALRKVSGSGGTLWSVAARELGDATQASRIAALNGLNDPMLQGQWTLLMPPPDDSSGVSAGNAGTGGLPPA